MRLIPVLMAFAVAAIVYALVIEREATLDWVATLRPAEDAAVDPAETASATPAVAATPAAAAPETDLIKVVVQTSTAREIDSAVILRGQTAAAREVDVRAETGSTVLSEPIAKGTFVEAGQLLCELKPGTRGAVLAEAKARLTEATARRAEAESRVPEAQARLMEAEAVLDEALTNQNVARRLNEDGFAAETRVKNADAAVAAARAAVEGARAGLSASQSGLRSADAAIESAEAGVAAAEKELERLEIRAPFSGLLESDTAQVGSLLQPGDMCATVIQLDPIKLVGFVPETEVNRVEVGARAGAQLAASDEQVTGRVTFLSRSADMTTRTFRVEIDVANEDLLIRDGQTAEIAISAEGAKAHLLPASALTLDDQGTLGLRLVDDDGIVSFSPVEVVRDTTQGVWLTGLPETANVIVVGQEFVTAGVQVAPSFREATQ